MLHMQGFFEIIKDFQDEKFEALILLISEKIVYTNVNSDLQKICKNGTQKIPVFFI